MRLRQKTATFFAQLYKCLNSSKREVYSLSPSVVRPDVQKLRDAIDNALFLSERMKGVSVSSAASLKKMTHTASTIARVVYIPNNMDSATTRSSHHKLIRIRRFLTLASQVAAIMHGVLEKMLARGFNLQASEKVVDKENSKQKQEHKAELSMDELADLFMSKFNTSESVSCDYSRLSFRDPRKHELTYPVIPKEQYPGIALQDGGVKFILRESPLTKVLQRTNTGLNSYRPGILSYQMMNNKQTDRSWFKIQVNRFIQKLWPSTSPTVAVATKNSFLHPFNKSKVTNSLLSLSQSAKQMQGRKAELSMDELTDLFMSKFNTSESVSCDYLRLSFKDPRKHELTSPVIPKEQYPGLTLQDGGVKFVLRESPLTQVLQQRKSESVDVATLPQKMLKVPQVEEMICDSRDKSTEIEMMESLTTSSIIPMAAKQNPMDLCSTDIVKSTTSSLNKLASIAMMKQAGRRLPPNLSNIATARISLGSGYNSVSETEKYWRFMGANVEEIVTDVRMRLRKVKLILSLFAIVCFNSLCIFNHLQRTASEAGLPMPSYLKMMR